MLCFYVKKLIIIDLETVSESNPANIFYILSKLHLKNIKFIIFSNLPVWVVYLIKYCILLLLLLNALSYFYKFINSVWS
jgi:hypothetical protein